FNAVTGVVYTVCDFLGILSIVDHNFSVLPSSCVLVTALTVNPVNNALYIHCATGSGVVMLNAGVETSVVSANICLNASSISVNPASGVAYVGCAAATFATVLAVNGAATLSMTSCQQTANFWREPATGNVYATCNDQILLLNGYEP